MHPLWQDLAYQTRQLKRDGLFKPERVIESPQSSRVRADGKELINLCANNYLGLSNHPALIACAHESLDRWGYGMSSVRFICGTQSPHKALEKRLADFLGLDDTILYSSCFDANTGLFETILGPEDAIISDSLNHASIIDGVRLCKARRLRYRSGDMADLEAKLIESKDARHRLICTDGVFSMDGIIAPLPEIVALKKHYDALLMVDDSHAVGFMGSSGAGTHEHYGLLGEIDIVTGTLGKALGGASGGYTAGRSELITWLRQRSRPYLFSNSLAPSIAACSLRAIDLIQEDSSLRERLWTNTHHFRSLLEESGFSLAGAGHPIIPVMVGDAKLAAEMAEGLLAEGVYVTGFSYPVVPKGEARIRTQMSAALSESELSRAASSFAKVGHKLGVIS